MQPLAATATHPHPNPASGIIDATYEVLRPLSRSHLSEVFEARHRYTRRTVAVKIGKQDATRADESRARLRREARALGAMDHPSITAVLDAGTCAQWGPYVVTEMLEGRSIDGLLAARGRLEIAGVVHVLRGVAAALGEVHRRGFVHRDVRPANVFAAMGPGGTEVVKLIDFGIVGVLDARAVSETITQLGAVLGTPGYMAPEQLADASSADGRADLYSLGLLALECLGVPPTVAGPAGGGRDVRMRVDRVASTTLASRTDVPAALVTLLDELTSPDARRRPRDAEHVIARLDAAFGPARAVSLLGVGATGVAAPDATPPAPTGMQEAPRGPEEDPRRKEPRAPYVTPVRIVHEKGVLDGRTEDVSAGGVLVVTAGDAGAIQGAAHVRFALPTTGKMVTLPVHVRWKREQPGRTAVGLSFFSVTPEVRDAIATYVKWLSVER